MDEYERLQSLLALLRDEFCRGVAAELGRKIDADGSYVNRLFYPKTKKGAKGIGPAVMRDCTEAFSLPKGFWDSDSPEDALALLAGDVGAVSPVRQAEGTATVIPLPARTMSAIQAFEVFVTAVHALPPSKRKRVIDATGEYAADMTDTAERDYVIRVLSGELPLGRPRRKVGNGK